MSERTALQELGKGVWAENPLLVMVLGMCPSLAVTTTLANGLGMGAAVIFVLTCSNVVISMLRRVIPSTVRIPAFIVVIASFGTMVDLVMEGFLPDLHRSLGVFIPLIVVNCIILARAEAFASKNSVWKSALDGIGMGLGFTLAITVLGGIRELLGNGTLLGMPVLGRGFQAHAALVMILPPGGFLTLGLLMAAMQARKGR